MVCGRCQQLEMGNGIRIGVGCRLEWRLIVDSGSGRRGSAKSVLGGLGE